MNEPRVRATRQSAKGDGAAGVAIALLSVALMVFVIIRLV